jgi:hypothetical protein
LSCCRFFDLDFRVRFGDSSDVVAVAVVVVCDVDDVLSVEEFVAVSLLLLLLLVDDDDDDDDAVFAFAALFLAATDDLRFFLPRKLSAHLSSAGFLRFLAPDAAATAAPAFFDVSVFCFSSGAGSTRCVFDNNH